MIQLDLCFYVVDSSPKFLENSTSQPASRRSSCGVWKKSHGENVISNDPRGDTLPKFNMEPKNDGFQ